MLRWGRDGSGVSSFVGGGRRGTGDLGGTGDLDVGFKLLRLRWVLSGVGVGLELGVTVDCVRVRMTPGDTAACGLLGVREEEEEEDWGMRDMFAGGN